MNRRDFSALLPLVAAASALAPEAVAQTATPPAHLDKLVSGQYPPQPPKLPPTAPRVGRSYLVGMLPDNIRLEAHQTHLAPGAPPEPIGHHKHSEIWLMHEGEATLMTNGVTRTLKTGDMGLCVAGDAHTITNASQSEPASYFVVTVGPPE
ncbi:MAG: cupin domain-containing protein [Terracidiphilus sp.]|nr:cupin domain-containing protein [Terracidiphilus sp.]